MSFKIIQQLIILGVGIALVFLYIQPQLGAIQEKQNEVATYSEAVATAAELNRELNNKLNQINSISNADLARMERFLPFTIDTVAIARDVETIAQRNSLIVNSISTSEIESEEAVRRIQVDTGSDAFLAEEVARNLASQLAAAEVAVSVTGEYESLMTFLAETESNAYPLQVTSFSVSSEDDDGSEEVSVTSNQLLTYDITFKVHSVATTI